jgi:putative radical SAM enzyme (TIGR03279 family)
LKIDRVIPKSIAEDIGLRAGDDLVRINDAPVRDPIDYEFWIHDTPLILTVERQGRCFEVELDFELTEPLGVDFEPMRYRCCGNKCIFCFVDQNPPNLRQTLYFKDEDYRLSFLYGNYVTLTNSSQADLERIVSQRLSPLYVSVHAVDRNIRMRMLGLKRDDHLMQKLELLAAENIEIHAQIVLCPGWNDGRVLSETVSALAGLYPSVQSVAIVPVGLTRHRKGLVPLQPVTAAMAKEIIAWHQKQVERFSEQPEHHFLYLADEFYLLSGTPLPKAEMYDQFYQIENGVGLTRAFIDQFFDDYKRLKSRLKPLHFSVVTAKMAAPVWETFLLPELLKVSGIETELYPIDNRFYGDSITVTGLLTGQDIAEQLRDKPLGDFVLLPANIVNVDKRFLDDWTLEKLSEKLNKKLMIADDDTHFLDKLAGCR